MGFSGNDAGGFQWEGFESGAPSQQRPKKPRKPRKQIKSPAVRVLINLGVTLAVAFVYFYFELPAINLQALSTAAAPFSLPALKARAWASISSFLRSSAGYPLSLRWRWWRCPW